MSKEKKSLSTLVRTYRRERAPELKDYLRYFEEELDSLEEVIRFACLGRDGKIHEHQHRVGRKILMKASTKLLRHADDAKAFNLFQDLIDRMDTKTRRINRFGELAVYGASLKIGAHLDLWPKVVYLHAGTKEGCRALGVKTKGSTVEMETLPKPVRALEPYQAGDKGVTGRNPSRPRAVPKASPEYHASTVGAI